MGLEEQNKLADEITNILKKRLKGMPLHFSLSVAGGGSDGFAFSISSLTEQNTFEDCRIVVRGTINETRALMDKFEFPSDTKIKKPVEFK